MLSPEYGRECQGASDSEEGEEENGAAEQTDAKVFPGKWPNGSEQRRWQRRGGRVAVEMPRKRNARGKSGEGFG